MSTETYMPRVFATEDVRNHFYRCDMPAWFYGAWQSARRVMCNRFDWRVGRSDVWEDSVEQRYNYCQRFAHVFPYGRGQEAMQRFVDEMVLTFELGERGLSSSFSTTGGLRQFGIDPNHYGVDVVLSARVLEPLRLEQGSEGWWLKTRVGLQVA